jgi:hypothetical protein
MATQKYHGDDEKHSGVVCLKRWQFDHEKRRIEIVKDKSDEEYRLSLSMRENLSIKTLGFYVTALCNRCQFFEIDIASFLP